VEAYTYVVDGGRLTLPSAASMQSAADRAARQGDAGSAIDSPGGASTDLAYRYRAGKYAFGFNNLEQQMLASGGATVVAAAICALPAIGWLACTIVGVVVAVATTYVTRYGVCSRGRTLWWYDVRGGSVVQCRFRAPF
jgi:hypothetical protein